MRQISFEVNDDLHREAKIKAAQKGISLTSIFRKALKDFVDENKREERKERQ